ncbi:class III lanthionine synthetase LanKC N-terminal domain-containing protein [Streptomyces litchfieldiae]|uniref:non-specific serine/threonine protein kinase n=1 Tax=Streptomyces litchfieldiae TaxID=3075543 RepID=A0ABU2MUS9_9ACTN|nr:lanthionine synthetase LanC family protein [Streptomyces sp. DSM 44938]MDT0344304.1 lanthionine synthetase LanC family protein [Streptomyces sp. DSM 44938]
MSEHSDEWAGGGAGAGPGWDGVELIRRALAAAPGAGHSLHVSDSWITVVPAGVPLAEHGWKLHISARAGTFPQLAGTLLPFLLAERCHFKIVRSGAVLTRVNSGLAAPAAVGKAVTVYPDPGRVRDLGRALARLLRGHEGPRVLSDRRVAADAPVYYRYGPFAARWYAGERGGLGIRIPGPGGAWFDAVASLEYRQPSWVADPFRAAGPDGSDSSGGSADPVEEPVVLGGRYRLTRGIYRAAHGNVFRAEDTATGRRVIVKQARAHVAEGRSGDARTRLRNERRVLTACAGIEGVPTFHDHFAHGPDEFLVTADVGALNLLHHVRLNGALPLGTADALGEPLAVRLAGTIAALHDRGVLMRDITPRNVVLGPDRPFLVDFGLAALDGLQLPGGTPGFAPPGQLRGEPPGPADDCFAFGMTLGYAATGMLPLTGVTDRELARRRMLQALTAVPPAVVETIDGLLSPNEARATGTLRAFAAGRRPPAANGPLARPLAPEPPDEPAALLEERVLSLILSAVDRHQLDGDEAAIGAVDASVHTGSAGLGLALLRHRERPGVPRVLRRLIGHARDATRKVALAEGLFAGSTGIELFLARARAAGFDAGEVAPAGAPEPQDDVFSGAAGVGLGQLLLAEVSDDPAERLAFARGEAEVLMARSEPLLGVGDAGLPPGAGVAPSFGYAHGLSGIVDFLVGLAAVTGDPDVARAALDRSRRLARRARQLAAAAGAPSAVPIAASWCQGLAGAARALQHAGVVLDEPECVRAAAVAGDACVRWIPRMENLSQCCGVCGVGSALLDLADSGGGEKYRAAAGRVARHLMVRSHGPDDAPELIALTGQDAPLSFGMGYAGVLAFLYGLRSPGAPDVLAAVVTPAARP